MTFDWEKESNFKYIAVFLAVATLVWRYREPGLLYPEISDALWTYLHSNPHSDILARAIFGMSLRALSYASFGLLHPPKTAFLPDTEPEFLGTDDLPGMIYSMMMLGVVNFWQIIAAAYIGRFIFGTSIGGIIFAVLLIISPHQNLMATAIDSQILFVFAILFSFFAIYAWKPDGRDDVRSGFYVGCAAALPLIVSHHSWFLIASLCSVVSIAAVFDRLPMLRVVNWRLAYIAVKLAIPYILGILAGICAVLGGVEGIFWLNYFGGEFLYEINPSGVNASYFGWLLYFNASFPIPFTFENFVYRIEGYWKYFETSFAWPGKLLIFGGMLWCIVRHRFGFSRGVGAIMPSVFALTFFITALPIVPGYGRMMVPLEVSVFLVFTQVFVDTLAVSERRRLASIPMAVLGSLLAGHMLIASYVIQENNFGKGRAAHWLKENPRPIYWTTGSYGGSMRLTVEQVRQLDAATNGYLIVGAAPDNDWLPVLKKLDVLPLKMWRTAKASWIVYDVLNTEFTLYSPYAFSSHTVVYDIRDVIAALNGKQR